ncbi:MAG: hypothetical protein ACXVZO_11410 [Gaiellaceae bacterium]
MRTSEIEACAARVRADRRRGRDGVLLALLAAAAIMPAGLLSPGLALALVAGAAAELVLVSTWRSRAATLVRELAVHEKAHSIPEVRAFGERLASPAGRERLAGRIAELCAAPWSAVGERVVACRADLEALAEKLLTPDLVLEPSCAAACQRLLNDGSWSPLLNPRRPAEDARVALHHIRAGFSEAAPSPSGLTAATAR